MPFYRLLGVICFFTVFAAGRCTRSPTAIAPTSQPDATPNAPAEPIRPIPLTVEVDERKVRLGEALFNDPRLSGDQSTACVTCHSLETGGTDRLPRSVDSSGQEMDFNAPTVFNSGNNFVQFWDGRAKDLQAQIDFVVLGPAMNTTWEEVIPRLNQDPSYVSDFSRLYPEGITPVTIKDAIAAYEQSLITPNSRFDRYLRGDRQALTPGEAEGYRIFKAYGCSSCHQGMNIGGNLFQKFGVMQDPFMELGPATPADLGRFNITHEEQDRHVFKVPSLRNVAVSPPYLHDGSARTLEMAVRYMARYQLGRPIDKYELEAIVQFLQTLTGEYQGKPLE